MAGNMWGNTYAGGQQQMQGAANGVMTVFVNGETSAMSYLVGAGNTVNLVDLDGGKMWFKSTDVNGMPCPLRTFEIKEVTPQPNNGDVVSRKEFDNLSQQLQSMQQLLMNLQAPAQEKGGKTK
jgi:hypothetical protein